ncbi:low molecular weight phosphatase family protein [Microbacterium thalassium]|uniref:protein-tyrosine-phosphatase n=1 Tax=Microbacterium thalassium TaxID=362649 RepID=A0A7X0FPA1_9MICO|nr:low molecular weight phosphatase family protein [Microbacterium thalassium]MBB6391079.1 protein-tyrosine phosphatase [Microbacterium thalassium]GLK23810.1 low molecular weight phosphatase family protein [Microbacterium thalassium]
MVEILTVCTGNICRSPLAELLLRTRLMDLHPTVSSAGTRGLARAPMTPESVSLADQLGVPADIATQHRSRFLTEHMLKSPDLILAMSRNHRRVIAELAPTRLRSTFTVREFARLAADLSDAEIIEAATTAGTDAASRVRAAAALVATRRGIAPPPKSQTDDDVTDPFGHSWQTYVSSANQLVPALDEVERVVRAALA